MAKFGQRMALEQLARSQYGASARKLKNAAEAGFDANGHKRTPWEMDREAGVYFLSCGACRRSVRLSMGEDSIKGGALTVKCNGRPWI